MVAELVQDRLILLFRNSRGRQIAPVDCLAELVGQSRFQCLAVCPGGIELNLSGGVDDSRAEDDRRQMAFADGTQAHEESNAPGRYTFLNHGGDDRRIEEGDRLDGVFHREAGADKQLLSLGSDFESTGTAAWICWKCSSKTS